MDLREIFTIHTEHLGPADSAYDLQSVGCVRWACHPLTKRDPGRLTAHIPKAPYPGRAMSAGH